MRKGQTHLRLLVEQAPISMAIFHRTMDDIATSRRWVHGYGRGNRDLVGRNHDEVHPDLPEEWIPVHREALAGASLKNDEDLWVQADGTRQWLRWAVHPWTDAVRPLRILVADDDRDVVESLDLLLELTGDRVEKAYDGLQEVDIAERCLPDLVLHDIGMPNLDGNDACRRIREQPRRRDMPVAALTGWGQEDDRRRSQGAGFNGHLAKPVDRSDLLRLLAEQHANRS